MLKQLMDLLWAVADPFPALLKNMVYKQSVESNGLGIMRKILAKKSSNKECTNQQVSKHQSVAGKGLDVSNDGTFQNSQHSLVKCVTTWQQGVLNKCTSVLSHWTDFVVP